MNSNDILCACSQVKLAPFVGMQILIMVVGMDFEGTGAAFGWLIKWVLKNSACCCPYHVLLSFHGRISTPYDIFVRFESPTLLQWTCILHIGHTAHPPALRTNSDVGPVLLSTWPVRALLLEIVLQAPFSCWKPGKCFCDLLSNKIISCISIIIYNQNY